MRIVANARLGESVPRCNHLRFNVSACEYFADMMPIFIAGVHEIFRIRLVSGLHGDQHGCMLKICEDILPQSLFSYVAFRVAFRETFERLALWKQFEKDPVDSFGYLGEVPFLKDVAPHVQLDVLAATWRKHLKRDPVPANLVDESVIYAVCETAAQLVEQEPALFANYLRGGPFDVGIPIDHFLATELRNLYLKLSNEGDFLLIGQFLDSDPAEALPLKRQMGLRDDVVDAMYDVLSRWHVSPQFLENARGLLTEAEIHRVAALLRVPCPA